MARKPRLEYAGAVYHVINRGNRRQAIFRTDEDRNLFLSTLQEVCERTGWVVHAYVLMGNHFHFLLETPEPNLVAGMQWLQGTYTKRFNAVHREWGHLFQGRYKAIPIDPGGDYLLTVATYIHLNPVRVKGSDFERQQLKNFPWSSFPGYLSKSMRMSALRVDRVLSSLALEDTPSGRVSYSQYMMRRVLEVQYAQKPWEADAKWKDIRRGWCLGGAGFRTELVDRMGRVVEKDEGTAFGGDGFREHNERQAIQLLEKGLGVLGLRAVDLKGMRKSSPEKCALAWLIRKRTSVKTEWIKERLHMGAATNFSELLKRVEATSKGEPGHAELTRLKSIKI